MSTLSLQIDYDKKKIYVLEEILGKPENKDNNTPKLSQKVKDKYLTEKHTGGLLITHHEVVVEMHRFALYARFMHLFI